MSRDPEKQRQHVRNWRKKNPDKYREIQRNGLRRLRARRKEDPERYQQFLAWDRERKRQERARKREQDAP